jgi:hypothetical protein
MKPVRQLNSAVVGLTNVDSEFPTLIVSFKCIRRSWLT